jgi:hypothetical protein
MILLEGEPPMTDEEMDLEDADVPERAVAALYAASLRSIAAGHPQVVVQNGELVRITPEGVTVLKKVRSRIPVADVRAF